MRTSFRTGIIVAFFAAVVAALFMPLAASATPGSANGEAGVQNIALQFFSGTIAAGASANFHKDNATPLDLAYTVDLSPKGASTTKPCEFQVTRTWYQQLSGGEREFWLTIKNVGTIDCGTDVKVYARPNIAGAWNTGGLNPGQFVTKHWNNNPLDRNFFAGVSPIGATNTAACQFEVFHSWYQQVAGGEREFYFSIKNVGTIACTADILLGMSDVAAFTSQTASLAPAASATITWLPVGLPVLGMSPQGATAAGVCEFDMTDVRHQQWITSGGVAQYQRRFTVTNTGPIACSTKVLGAAA